MNLLLLAWQGKHGGIAPTQNLEVTVGAVPLCQPQSFAIAGILPRNIY